MSAEIIRDEDAPTFWWCEKHWRDGLTREPCECPQAVRMHLQSAKTQVVGNRVRVWLEAVGIRGGSQDPPARP